MPKQAYKRRPMPFNGRFVMNMAHFAAQQGAELEQLIALSGQSAEQLCQEDCTVENSVYNAVMDRAIELTDDPFFGLHAGESLNLAAAGLIGQITHTCRTVKEALDYCCAFANLGCSALPMELQEEKHHYKLTLTPAIDWAKQSPTALRHTAEGVLAFSVREFHSLTRQQHSPIKVHLPWAPLSSTSEYERVLGCSIFFNQSAIALFLQKEHVEDHVITANYELLRVLVAHAEEKSAALAAQTGFSNTIRQVVVKLMQPDFPTIATVAAHLNLSVRSLQRQLKTEKTTYSALIDELRQEFAVSYLKRPQVRVGEVAQLLGYAETSTFSRWFKGKMGLSPNQYRSKHVLIQ